VTAAGDGKVEAEAGADAVALAAAVDGEVEAGAGLVVVAGAQPTTSVKARPAQADRRMSGSLPRLAGVVQRLADEADLPCVGRPRDACARIACLLQTYDRIGA
jgi:hypothetical protein